MSGSNINTNVEQRKKRSKEDIEQELSKIKIELKLENVSDDDLIKMEPPLDNGHAELSRFLKLQDIFSKSLQEKQALLAEEQHKGHKETDNEDEVKIALPDLPKELLNLPYMLGELQNFIYNRMSYPCKASAGIAALASMTAFSQTNITIISRDGLGFNELYMILAPTGFGKEELRTAITLLEKLSSPGDKENLSNNIEALISLNTTKLHYGAPASAQGMHEHLERNHSILYLADEFAVWLKQGKTDSAKQGALGYLMQSYTRATGTIEPGHAVTKEYKPVKDPRVSVFSTSTGEAMFETMSKEDAESGAYNRWVIFAADLNLPKKRYKGLVYEPSQRVVDFITKLRKKPPGSKIKFSEEGFEKFMEIDEEEAEPIKRRDGILGGRLSEQAIKMAGLIALADDRTEISPEDIEMAFKIRIGLYNRTKLLAMHEGKLDGRHPTIRALNQIIERMKTIASREKNVLYRSAFPSISRAYDKLSANERNQVISELTRMGYEVPCSKGTRFVFKRDDA